MNLSSAWGSCVLAEFPRDWDGRNLRRRTAFGLNFTAGKAEQYWRWLNQ